MLLKKYTRKSEIIQAHLENFNHEPTAVEFLDYLDEEMSLLKEIYKETKSMAKTEIAAKEAREEAKAKDYLANNKTRQQLREERPESEQGRLLEIIH